MMKKPREVTLGAENAPRLMEAMLAIRARRGDEYATLVNCVLASMSIMRALGVGGTITPSLTHHTAELIAALTVELAEARGINLDEARADAESLKSLAVSDVRDNMGKKP